MPTVDGIELRQLVCNNEFKPRWEPYELGDVGPNDVRIKSELTAAKHGTEKASLLGTDICRTVPWVESRKLFDRSKEHSSDPTRWQGVGNTTVGTVIAAGSEVKEFKVGDRVYGYGGFRTVHQGNAGRFKKLVEGLTPEAACCLDPADFAMAAVRDAHIRVGEQVIIFGMGAIGLFTVQFARLSGAIDVIAVDPIAVRRELALQHGATMAVDPAEVGDFGMATREWFPNGADVTIEASGSHHALNQALRATCFGGRIVVLAYCQGEAKGLYLGEEFHFNQLNIISARACSDPQRDPFWNEARIFKTLVRLFVQGGLKPYGMPDPIVKPDDLPEAYGKILHAPKEVIKVAVRY